MPLRWYEWDVKADHKKRTCAAGVVSPVDFTVCPGTGIGANPGGVGSSSNSTGRPALYALIASWYC